MQNSKFEVVLNNLSSLPFLSYEQLTEVGQLGVHGVLVANPVELVF